MLIIFGAYLLNSASNEVIQYYQTKSQDQLELIKIYTSAEPNTYSPADYLKAKIRSDQIMIDGAISRFELIRLLAVAIINGGGLLSFWGFVSWYMNVQRFEDEILQRKAKLKKSFFEKTFLGIRFKFDRENLKVGAIAIHFALVLFVAVVLNFIISKFIPSSP